MKSFACVTLAAALAAGVSAHGHDHQHAHLHKKHAGSPVQKREPNVATVYVAGATETVYESNGKILEADEAEAGLKEGDFVVVGESEPTYVPPPPPKPSPKPKTSSSLDLGAQFIESKPSTTQEPETTSSSEPPPPPPSTSSEPEPEPSPEPKPSPKPKVSKPKAAPSGGKGLDSPFPDKTVDCSDFPSDYGAVPIDYLKFGKGWSGLQHIPDFTLGATSFASKIVTGIANDDCKPNTLCSYACPPGYEKTQWPQAQGPRGESVGGLFCDSNGKLRLTRHADKNPTLCKQGVPGIKLVNKLSSEVSVCRTDYPGTENMVLPNIAQPGSSVDICNPSQKDTYEWQGKKTSAQYYVNPSGISPEKGCDWASEGSNRGNWAPVNIGMSQSPDGTSFIGLFQNELNPTGKLDYNIKFEGDTDSSSCGYKNGKYLGSNPNKGCTASVPNGGSVNIVFY